MKKTLSTLIAVLGISTLANAQGFFIGGSISGEKDKNYVWEFNREEKQFGNKSESEYKTFSIEPEIGYSFNDNWEMGVSFMFSQQKGDELDTGTDMGALLYGRRYFELGGNFSWFVDGGVTYSISKNRFLWENDSISNSKEQELEFFIEPGISYDINDHWSLEMSFDFLCLSYGLNWYKDLDENKNPNDNKYFSKSLSFECSSIPGSIYDITNDVSLSLYYNF